MLRQRVRVVLRTRRRALVAWGLLVLLLLGGVGYVVATAAASLEITVSTPGDVMTLVPGKSVPSVQIYDKIITNQRLVQDIQDQLDALNVSFGGCTLAPGYIYQLSFATHGVTTVVYSGSLSCVTWTMTRFGATESVDSPDSTTLYGYNLMTTLHKLTGMPLPSWWSATLPAS